MALLTAEDVLNKAFSKTKYREGFDQDEVDDFLDEVANTIAALTAERDELAARLAQGQAGGGYSAPAVAPESATPQSFIAAATDPNPPSATSMLAMAQKLHDEYLSAGEAERDKIIAAAHKEAETILERAEAEAKERMASLEGERADLERKIDDLRRFERDYRNHLKSYLENVLGDLEHVSQRGTGSIPTPSLDSFLSASGDSSASPVVSSPTPVSPFGSAELPEVKPFEVKSETIAAPSGSVMAPATSLGAPVVPSAETTPNEGTRLSTTAPNDEPTGSVPEVTPRPTTPDTEAPASQPLPQWPTA